MHPDHQGEGIGKDLLDRVIEEAEKAGKKELLSTVRAENPASLAAMLGRGFRVVGFDPNYYPGKQGEGHRLVCSKPLGQEPAPEKREPRSFQSRQADHPVLITVQGGDDIDQGARAEIETLLGEGRLAGQVLRSPRHGHFDLLFSSANQPSLSALQSQNGRVLAL